VKAYAVSLTVMAVIMAEDAAHARQVTENEKREIFGEAYGKALQISQAFEVRTVAELTQLGWDGMCLPYGGDGNTRLKDILEIP
jgi:regulator of protease activity HflC (stomatin/prohibitin superfamily)